MSGQHHAPAALYPWGKSPRTHCIGGWVGSGAGMDAETRRKILCLCRESNPDRPVRSQTELPRLLLTYAQQQITSRLLWPVITKIRQFSYIFVTISVSTETYQINVTSTFRRNITPPSSGRKMDTVCFFQTLMSTHQSTWRANS
jgi:hypothetical protein